MSLRNFLTCLDFDEYQTLGFLMFPHRIMFGSLVVYLTHFVSYVHFQCFGYAMHIATSCTHLSYPCHALVYTLFILAWHIYLMLCSILLCLRFELHFHIHLTPLMHHYHCSYLHLLPYFLLDPLSIPNKKGESIL